MNLEAFQLSHFLSWQEAFSCNRRAYGTAKTTSLGVNHSLPVRNYCPLVGQVLQVPKARRVIFLTSSRLLLHIWKCLPTTWSIGRGRRWLQGSRSRIWILVSRNKSGPPPPPPPFLCPLFWEPRRRVFPVLPARAWDHLLAVGLRVCEEWVPVEGRLPVGPDGAREYISPARASGISALRPGSVGCWFGWWWDAAGSVAAFCWCGRLLPREYFS